jgi:glycerate-2-kinase
MAEIGHSDWLKSTTVLAEMRLLLSKISKLRGGKLAGYVHYYPAQPSAVDDFAGP